MILEISSALISMRFLSEAARPPLPLFEPILDLDEARGHAAVVNRAPNPGHYTADNRLVHLRRHGHDASGRGSKSLLQLRRALWRKGNGCCDFRTQHVAML